MNDDVGDRGDHTDRGTRDDGQDLCVVDDQGALQRVMQAGRWLAEPT